MSGVGGGSVGTSWYGGAVLGETYRSRRCVSTSAAAAAAAAAAPGIPASALASHAGKKSSTSSRLHKTPRPNRTRQIFTCVKRGVQDCIRMTDADIARLKEYDVDATSVSSPCQFRMIEVEKRIKQAERYKKRLEFHLFKLEELEDSYVLHQQLREGVKTMARAFISHAGSSRRSSIQNVERGHKECTQTLCAIEAQLENLLGSFHCSMTGLFGFARLVPGDNCEMQLRYGSQKWKCKGKIGENAQSWEPQSFPLKAVISDVFYIRLSEVRSFGKNVVIGEKSCDTLELFAAQRQSLNISLNTTGSIKLQLLVKWTALDGVDECGMSTMDVPRRMLATSRRHLPIRSLIESDGLEFCWQNETASSPVQAANRLSMPVFPASSFGYPSSSTTTTTTSGCVGVSSPCRQGQVPGPGLPRCGVAVTVEAAARRLNAGRRPCSEVVVPTSVSDQRRSEEVLRESARSRSVGALVPHNLSPPPSPPPPPQARLTLDYLVADLQTTLNGLQGRHGCLQALSDQLTAVDQLIKKNTAVHSEQSSNESILIESALEAFSFLDNEDCIGDERFCGFSELWSINCHMGSPDTELDVLSSSSTAPASSPRDDVFPVSCSVPLGGDSTLRTTDSGIGSIAQRPARRSTDSRVLTKDCSQAVLSGTGSTSDDDDDDEADEPVSAAESTPFNDDVDVALMWHLARCSTVIQRVDASTENSTMTELKKHTRIIGHLLEIASETDLNSDELASRLLVDGESAQFWRRCADSEHVLFCSSDSFATQLRQRLSTKLNCRDVIPICERALTHLLGSSGDRAHTDNRVTNLLSQTVTLPWLVETLNDHSVAGVDEYFNVLLQPSSNGL